MALSRAKYKRLPELYVAGETVELKDGSVMWVQVLNPFQAEEARHDAQVARSRLVMALTKHGSEEMSFVEAQLWSDGMEGARERLVEDRANDSVVKVVQKLRNDPEWLERVDIMDRSEEAGLEEVERTLLTEIQMTYVSAIQQALEDERAFLVEKYAAAERDELLADYTRLYIERRGADLAAAEFRTVEVWYGARVCDATRGDDGQWQHENCEGHATQVFESKADVRQLPQDLSALLTSAYDELAMSLRDAKDLDRLASSSDSSRQPSAGEASTPSTPDATPNEHRGISSPPSPTPSLS